MWQWGYGSDATLRAGDFACRPSFTQRFVNMWSEFKPSPGTVDAGLRDDIRRLEQAELVAQHPKWSVMLGERDAESAA